MEDKPSNIIRAPASRSVVDREAHRTTARALSLIDECDVAINGVLSSDEATVKKWTKHSDPIFDDESGEGSVIIDRVRLADIVRAYADANEGHFPQIETVTTNDLQNAVQRALRRTGESIAIRRKAFTAAADKVA